MRPGRIGAVCQFGSVHWTTRGACQVPEWGDRADYGTERGEKRTTAGTWADSVRDIAGLHWAISTYQAERFREIQQPSCKVGRSPTKDILSRRNQCRDEGLRRGRAEVRAHR